MKTIVSGRLDAALSRAAGRGRPRSLKEIANLIAVTDDTLRNYRNGATPIPADKLLALCDVLGQEFRAEVLAERLDRLLWFDDAGTMHETSDLDVFAREAQGLPPSIGGDHAAAIRRNNGWVSARIRDGVAAVRYHERGIKTAAARRVADRLTDGIAAAARRQIELEDQDGTARVVSIDLELPKDAALAVERAAGIAHLPSPRPPRIKRLRLDEFPHHHAKTLIHIATTVRPEGVLDALGRAKLLPKVSIIQRHNGSLYSVRVGEHVQLSPETKSMMVGRADGIPDIRYYEVMNHCVDETLAEGPTCRLISMDLFGRECEWYQAAFPGDQDTYISYVRTT